MLKPDAIFTCVKAYGGVNQDGKPLFFQEGMDYLRTTVDMKAMGHSTKELAYYFHKKDPPIGSTMEVSPEEFEMLLAAHLDNQRKL